jgi:hypothetical protein
MGPLVVGEIDESTPNASSVELFNDLPASEFPEQIPGFIPFETGESVAAGDLNGDGIAEVVIGGAPFPGTPRGVTIFDINGKQLDPVADLGFNFPAGGFIPGNSVAVGDVNGDGFGDIVVGTSPGTPSSSGDLGFVTVYLSHNASSQVVLGNKLSATFGANAQVPFAVFGAGGSNPGGTFFPNGGGLAACDVNHDGVDEVIVANAPTACADLDNDGFDDVVVANSVGGATVNVYSVPAQSQAGLFFTGLNTNPQVNQFTSIAAGDLDGDGFAEVAVGTPGAGLFIFTVPVKTPFLPGNGGLPFVMGDSVAIPRVLHPASAATTTLREIPYLLQYILYQPPGDKSTVTYGTTNMIGTNVTTTVTTKEGISVKASPVSVVPGLSVGGGGSVTVSQSMGQSATTSKTTGTTQGISVNDGLDVPDHGQDQFWMIFGASAFITDLHDGNPPNVSIDLSKGTLNRLTVSQLQGILSAVTQGTPLSGAITDPTLLQIVQNDVIEATPQQTEADLTNLLNMDPFVSGEVIANNPGRYEPATPATGMLFGPTEAGEDLNPSGQSYTATTGSATSNGNGTDMSESFTLGLPGISADVTFGISYSNVTTTTSSSGLTGQITFNSDHVCVQSDIQVFVDKAFGTFLAIPTDLSNPCMAQPLLTTSFESLADWTVQDGGVATLSDTVVFGAHSFSIAAAPGGWTPIVSNPLNSAQLRSGAKSSNLSQVSFALNIPTAQPNRFWIGDAQMFISSPSANVYNAPMGEINLTGLPPGQFDRLEFTIPSYALPAITGNNSDVSFTIVLNVNAGTTGWLIDDLEIGQ